MIVDIPKSVEKQLKKLPTDINSKAKMILEELRYADSFNEVQSEKLSGTKDRYKIRVGNYRIIIKKLSSKYIEITAIADRKAIYKKLFGIILSL